MVNDKYWETYWDLFITPGWKQLVEEFHEAAEAINIRNCGTWDIYLRRDTEKSMLEKIVNFETLIRAQHENWKTEQSAEE